MGILFQGVQWVAPTDLGISQLYLNQSKLRNVEKWFDPNNMNLCQPLPVHDFGDGGLTLTDGLSRAFIAYQHKTKVPIVYDTDDMATCDEDSCFIKMASFGAGVSIFEQLPTLKIVLLTILNINLFGLTAANKLTIY